MQKLQEPGSRWIHGFATHVRTAVGHDVGGGALLVRDFRQEAGAIPGYYIYAEIALR